MKKEFEFEDDGRTFSCSVESAFAPHTEKWWWFAVTGKDSQRYAPFRVAAGDTESSVRARIVAYYDALLVRRSQPAVSYWRRGLPNVTAAPPPEVAGAAGAPKATA